MYPEIEAELRRIDGVEGAVFVEERGRRRQLRVFVAPDAGDVEASIVSALATRAIPVQELDVQVTGRPPGGSEEATSRRTTMHRQERAARPAFQEVVTESSGTSSRAVVTLAEGGRLHIGSADRAPAGPVLDLAAEATVDALAAMLPRAGIVGAAAIEIAADLAVCVTVRTEDGQHVGACLLAGRSLPEATARATLDAVNRRLGGDRDRSVGTVREEASTATR